MFYLIISKIIIWSVLLVITSIAADFFLFHKNKKVKGEKKSIVETGTMFLFFFLFYIIIIKQIGTITIENIIIKNTLIILGTSFIVFGSLGNIAGRFNLGKNWGNQIKIYDEHKLVKSGMYKVVRHPLYATIILMFIGSCIVYQNIAAFLSVTIIFIPFMIYRIKQEEVLLTKYFPEYKEYQDETGMLFPKLFKRRNG